MTKISRLLLVVLLSLLMSASAYAAGNDANTVLLITGEEASTWANGETFTESSVGGNAGSHHTVTINDNATSATGQTGFGNAIYFDGDGDYLSIPDSDDWDFGSGDFTIDFWVKSYLDSGLSAVIYDQRYDSTYQASITLSIQSDQTLRVVLYKSSEISPPFTEMQSTTTINDNWHHIAVVRKDSTVTLYIDGMKEVDTTFDVAIRSAAANFYIGTLEDYTDYYFKGFLDNYRISKGIARTQDPNDPMYLTIDSDGDGTNDSFPVPTVPYSTESLYVSISTDVASGSLPLEVNFTPNATGGTWPYTYSWDFDGDSVEDSTDQNPSYTYNSSGSYTATVTVTDSNSSTATDTITINVNQTLSIDSYSATPSTGFTPLDVAFSVTPAGGIEPYTYSWDFDDDGVEDSTDQNPSYTYTSGYSGNAIVTVTDDDSNTVSQTIALSITELTSSDCYATYDFINNEFIVPCFEFDGVLYRIDMTLQAGDPYAFEVNTILAK